MIGNFNTIRECATIHRATTADIGVTMIGDYNLLMAYTHVAHNCKIGSRVVMSNAVNLAGHIHVEDFAIIGGMTGIHRSRASAPTASSGRLGRAPGRPAVRPGLGHTAKPYGLNLVGLKRRGFSEDTFRP